MASSAYSDHLEILLQDADELVNAHSQLKTGQAGRQWGLGALNRAVVVISVSAWEAYVEEVVKESVGSLRPANPPMGNWPSMNANARSLVGRFNNPNTDNVRSIIADTLGLQDVTQSWFWRACSAQTARAKLHEALRFRHEIAHGVNPRPTVHNSYASWLPGFFRRLGACTDAALHDYLVNTLGVANPWHP